MRKDLLPWLRCPVTRSRLQLQVITTSVRLFNEGKEEVTEEGILFAAEDWFYPVIAGIPRLGVEAFIDYASFFETHLPGFKERSRQLHEKYAGFIGSVVKKNAHTKKSFSQEWSLFDYEHTKTWNAGRAGMLDRFLKETNEQPATLPGKWIFDAGCGNGLLDELIAGCGAMVIAMDFSNSVERAYRHNSYANAFFIQGDVQFPPLAFEAFDIVHCSGVLIHTNNPELSFSCIEPCVKAGGKLSVWLYHPRRDLLHNLFNGIRRFTSKWPLKLQYCLYAVFLLPPGFVVKRLKGNKQTIREMMIDLLDWFTPQFRHEHEPAEAAGWFYKRNYEQVQVTTKDVFGYNIIGVKNNKL